MNDSNSASSPAKVWRLIDQNPFSVGHPKRARWDELCWLLEEREAGIVARTLASQPNEDAPEEVSEAWIVQAQLEVFDNRANVLAGIVTSYEDAALHEQIMATWVKTTLEGSQWSSTSRWRKSREELRVQLQQRTFQWKADCLALARAANEQAAQASLPPKEVPTVPAETVAAPLREDLTDYLFWAGIETRFRQLQRVRKVRAFWRKGGWGAVAACSAISRTIATPKSSFP